MFTVKNTIFVVKQNIEYHSYRGQNLNVIDLSTGWRYYQSFPSEIRWNKYVGELVQINSMFAMAVPGNTYSRIYLY